MNGLDYKLLHTLSVVIKQQSFAKAANELCLTQPAVSQKIKQLEQLLAHPVLIRSQPIVATKLGKKLLNHYYQVQQLEADLLPQIVSEQAIVTVTISLATNADSLATWLIPALASLIKQYPIELDLIVSHEETTIDKLKDGEVFGAISLQNKAITGCQLTELGAMRYILVASKEFKARYFSQGINAKSLQLAPGVTFDHKDNMHFKFIEEHFSLSKRSYPCHTVRSSEAFVALAKQGAAYCLIAEQQISAEIKAGHLINLLPEIDLVQILYWHHWSLLKGVYQQVSQAIINTGQEVLCKVNK